LLEIAQQSNIRPCFERDAGFEDAYRHGRCPTSIRQTLVAIIVLATASNVLAQTTETKPPDVRSSGATNSQSETIPTPNLCENGGSIPAEILSDPMGVDFVPYIQKMVQIIKQNWIQGLPPSAYPPIWKAGKDSIDFTILKNGQVTGVVWHSGSGDIATDRAAWGSIIASNPLPPLPKEFPGPNLGLRLNFSLNLSIRISPCGDVRVPTSTTLQFSASKKDATYASVTWRVSGIGCSKSACGTITEDGLYIAPIDIPNPPTIFVEATSRADTSITAKSKLAVVQPNPSH